MAAEQLSQVVRHLRSMVADQEQAGIADADLLRRFVNERDEVAFQTLMRSFSKRTDKLVETRQSLGHDDANEITRK